VLSVAECKEQRLLVCKVKEGFQDAADQWREWEKIDKGNALLAYEMVLRVLNH
jgi:hypothetical protein